MEVLFLHSADQHFCFSPKRAISVLKDMEAFLSDFFFSIFLSCSLCHSLQVIVIRFMLDSESQDWSPQVISNHTNWIPCYSSLLLSLRRNSVSHSVEINVINVWKVNFAISFFQFLS